MIAEFVFKLGAVGALLWLSIGVVLLVTPRRKPGRFLGWIPWVRIRAERAAERRIDEVKANLTSLHVRLPDEAIWPRDALRNRYLARCGIACVQTVPTVLVWMLFAVAAGLTLTSDARLRVQLAILTACLALFIATFAAVVVDRVAGERGRSEDCQYEAIIEFLAAVEPEVGTPSMAEITRCNERAERLTSALVRHAYFAYRTGPFRRDLYVVEAARAGSFVEHVLDEVRGGRAALDAVAVAALAVLEQLGHGQPLNLVPAGASSPTRLVPVPRTPSLAGTVTYVLVAALGVAGLIALSAADIDSHVADIVTAVVVSLLSIPPLFAAGRSQATGTAPNTLQAPSP